MINIDYHDISVSVVFDNVCKIILNRPDKLNSFSTNMYNEVIRALDEADRNPNVVLCCFTGNGKYYSSGNDLSNFTKYSNEDTETLIENGTKLCENFIKAIINFSKPLVALVNGPVVGIAFTTLALFDLVIASDMATFSAPFTRLALSPEGCSSYTFPLLMGNIKANEILLFNRKLNAAEAYERNIVAEIVADADFVAMTNRKLEEFSKIPQNSILKSRNLMRLHQRNILLKVNAQEIELLTSQFKSGEFLENVIRFLSKKSKL